MVPHKQKKETEKKKKLLLPTFQKHLKTLWIIKRKGPMPPIYFVCSKPFRPTTPSNAADLRVEKRAVPEEEVVLEAIVELLP